MNSLQALDPRLTAALCSLTEPGLDALVRCLRKLSQHLVPNPPTRAADWIEQNLEIPDGPRPGPVKLDIVQRTVCDILQEDGITHLVWLKPPRAGSSTLTALLLIFKAAYEGKDTVFYERTDEEAKRFTFKKLRKILEASKKIAHLVRGDSRSGLQDSWSDIYLLNGATMQQRGVQIDSNFKAIRGELVAIDEAGDPAYAGDKTGGEGTKVGQAESRSAEYVDPRMYIGGTPTTLDSVVVAEHAKSDKRRLLMPFPCCSHVQAFEPWVSEKGASDELPYGLKFECAEVDGAREVVRIGYECANPSCRKWLPEEDADRVMELGAFVATEPRPKKKGVAGIETWAIHAKDPYFDWPKIIAKYQSQKLNPAERQEWENLWLARAFSPQVEGALDPHELEARCEPYEAPCPAGVRRIYVGIDTQEGSIRLGRPPRHELVFIGVGAGREVWVLGRYIIDRTEIIDPETGEVGHETLVPFGPDAARQIWAMLDKEWVKADGGKLKPSKVAVDIGHDWNNALAFCGHRESRKRKIVAVRGAKEARGFRAPPFSSPPTRLGEKKGTAYVRVGGNVNKDTLFGCLGLPVGRPGSFHFPLSLQGTDFFHQLTAESLQSDGTGKTWWDKHGDHHDPNEVLDCMVYAQVAMLVDLANPRSQSTRDDLGVALIGTREATEPYEGEDRSDQAGAPKHVTAGIKPRRNGGREEATAKRAARIEAVLSRMPEEKRAAARARVEEVDAAIGRALARRGLDAAAPPPAPDPQPRTVRTRPRSNRYLSW